MKRNNKTIAKPLSPLQKLLADKKRLHLQCEEKQKQIGETWEYIRENSGSLIYSGISGMLFPRLKSAPRLHKTSGKKRLSAIVENLPYYLSVTREVISIIWYATRPFYIKRMLSRQFRKQSL